MCVYYMTPGETVLYVRGIVYIYMLKTTAYTVSRRVCTPAQKDTHADTRPEGVTAILSFSSQQAAARQRVWRSGLVWGAGESWRRGGRGHGTIGGVLPAAALGQGGRPVCVHERACLRGRLGRWQLPPRSLPLPPGGTGREGGGLLFAARHLRRCGPVCSRDTFRSSPWRLLCFSSLPSVCFSLPGRLPRRAQAEGGKSA